jgi:hypothetical protein
MKAKRTIVADRFVFAKFARRFAFLSSLAHFMRYEKGTQQ